MWCYLTLNFQVKLELEERSSSKLEGVDPGEMQRRLNNISAVNSQLIENRSLIDEPRYLGEQYVSAMEGSNRQPEHALLVQSQCDQLEKKYAASEKQSYKHSVQQNFH